MIRSWSGSSSAGILCGVPLLWEHGELRRGPGERDHARTGGQQRAEVPVGLRLSGPDAKLTEILPEGFMDRTERGE